MSLENYTELQADIASFLNRDDLTAAIPSFIRLAEANMDRDLRHWRMEARVLAETVSQYLARPDDWVETIRLHALTPQGPQALTLLSGQAMNEERQRTAATPRCPRYYRHVEDSFELFPTPDATYAFELQYYKRLVRLSDTVQTNWVLEEAPDAYLYGALVHTAPYLQHDERIATWAALAGAAMQRLNQSSKKATESGSGLRMRNRGGP